MGIGSITSMNTMPDTRMTMASSTDTKNKNIQKEITDAEQQMRALSSKEELSVSEKANEKKTLQKKISSLNTELKQHEEELLKSQKREIRMAQLLEEQKPAKERKSEDGKQAAETPSNNEDKTGKAVEKGIGEKETNALGNHTNTAWSHKETQAAVSGNASPQQANRQGTVISRSNDGLVILKGKTNPNKKHGTGTEKALDNESPLSRAAEQTSPIRKPQAEEAKDTDIAENKTKISDSDANTGLSHKEIHAIVSADASVRQSNRQETVIARIENGIAILKGEINQDKQRGIDTEQKQAELKKMEQKEQRAREFQTSAFGEQNNTIKPSTETKVFGSKNGTQVQVEKNASSNASNLFQRDVQASQQRFFVSLDS